MRNHRPAIRVKRKRADVVLPGLAEDQPGVQVADVVIDLDAPDLLPAYTYRVPERLYGTVEPGGCVHVPFGAQELLGYVIALGSLGTNDPGLLRLKPIIAVVEGTGVINRDQLELAHWISREYIAPLAEAIKCVAPAVFASAVVTRCSLPAGIASSSLLLTPIQSEIIGALERLGKSARLTAIRGAVNRSGFRAAYRVLLDRGLLEERRSVVRVGAKPRYQPLIQLAVAGSSSSSKPGPAGRRILESLMQLQNEGTPRLPPRELLSLAKAGTAALKRLENDALVTRTYEPVTRRQNRGRVAPGMAPNLTAEQAQTAEWIRNALDSRLYSPALLFGVTASGKTEVYLNAIGHTLLSGRTALVLLPEIALTEQVVDVFVRRFGEAVAVVHSALSDGERYDEWARVQSGVARIVVGARSAVFAPLSDIGLIILDEEHEASYKQEATPRYHAREAAAMRAQSSGAALVLGSATPSLESFYKAAGGMLHLLEMRERVAARPMPTVHLVDMREELKLRASVFSAKLAEGIQERLDRKQQVILLLNRRGFAQFVLCRECGHVERCPNCAVSLALHTAARRLVCHHCDFSMSMRTICPKCGGARIRGFGIGTERVEEEAAALFPNAKLLRMDRDTTSRRGAHQKILEQFRARDADILIGTQMVAKGLDFHAVTLVGVVSADTSLHIPDFRSAERTFQLLTQVAGRAGRGDAPGEVIVQTFTPEHYSLVAAAEHDYRSFYTQEIEFRRELMYPPFSRFANVVCSSPDEHRARGAASRVAALLRSAAPHGADVLGPAPAPLARLKGASRWHVALRAEPGVEPAAVVELALGGLTSDERRIVNADIDPVSMA